METTILQHRIEYTYDDGYEGELTEIDIENIKLMIVDGFYAGQLCTLINGEEEHYGWWEINNE